MELWGITDSGIVRRENQDVFKIFYDDEKDVAVFVVCDGMGGARAGNVASATAAETFMHHMGLYIENIGAIDKTSQKISAAVVAANRAVYEKSARDDDYAGMGTTLVAAIASPDGIVAVNIGDSRIYHATRSRITQVSRDHSVIEDMIARGDITRAEARGHPNKHLITRALGTSGTEKPDVFIINPEAGEHILLCSDGLSNIVMDSEMLFEFQRGASVREICENLLKLALSRGAPDNVTAVVFRK